MRDYPRTYRTAPREGRKRTNIEMDLVVQGLVAGMKPTAPRAGVAMGLDQPPLPRRLDQDPCSMRQSF